MKTTDKVKGNYTNAKEFIVEGRHRVPMSSNLQVIREYTDFFGSEMVVFKINDEPEEHETIKSFFLKHTYKVRRTK